MSAEESPAPAPEPQAAAADDDAPEEEVTAQWESKYKDLKEVKVESGEEEDDILFKMRCKLFHFLKAEEKYGGQMEWKEKGVGDVKLLKNRKTSKIRLLMRREKTLKIVANHLVIDDGKGTFNLKEHPSSDRSWTYTAQDFSEGETQLTTFAIRFANADNANTFKAKYEECQAEQKGGDSAAAEEEESDDDDL